ncbi:FMN-binding negative transcriptional regulator [Nocardioides carbamazepini]|uniref:FMN-binding negative transcriptional regulator n=1 Tax=Nocardioides carbamazepini TaxID=2854259 RepID=UPI00214A679A|nr:FMN-binding negative transcriptional regulator [Nocardioides carbamazepini]MCR1786137.1 FMN-binding negative transcriptional regulator [Nocardioides carbamazepini]
MRHNPVYALTDRAAVRQLVAEHPFVTIVSATSRGLVASHYPVILDGSAAGGDEEIVLLGHVGRPDEELHELGEHEVLVVVHGAQGYVSPSWYDRSEPEVPTWNFTVAHLHGRPEILSAEENYAVLGRFVDHFEAGLAHPRPLEGTPEDAALAREIHRGTVGFRIRVTRVEAKRKLSQDKPDATVANVIDELGAGGRHTNPSLAADMRAHVQEQR